MSVRDAERRWILGATWPRVWRLYEKRRGWAGRVVGVVEEHAGRYGTRILREGGFVDGQGCASLSEAQAWVAGERRKEGA